MRIDERRKWSRLQAYHCVKYRILQTDKDPHAEPIVFLPASVRDISKGGVCLIIEENLPKNSLVELKINFPHLDNAISCVGKVVWSKRIGMSMRFEVGVEFSQIDKKTQDIIDLQIKNVYNTLESHKKMGILGRIFGKKWRQR